MSAPLHVPDHIPGVTVVMDRHGGAYSGGEWIAWPLRDEGTDRLEDWCDCGDGESQWFWTLAPDGWYPVGRGATPDAAVRDLVVVWSEPDAAARWERFLDWEGQLDIGRPETFDWRSRSGT